MQTQTTETKKAPGQLIEQLAEKVKAAEAQLETLRAAAGDAEAEAQRWEVTFKREPTEQAHAKKGVAAQKAVNAREAVETFERETLAPLVRQLRSAKAAAARAEYEAKERALRAKFETAFDHFVAAISGLDEAIAEMPTLQGARLEAEGKGAGVSPITLGALVGILDERFQRFHGRNQYECVHTAARAMLEHAQSRSDATICIHIQRPAASVPQLMR